MVNFLQRHLELINIIILGISFLFIFGSFQTSAMFMTTVLNSEKINTHGNFTGDGYTSLSIIYVTFAFANWIAPIFVVWLTPKYSMIVSAIIYTLYIVSFLKPITAVLYTGSVLLGIAAAVLWTAQGNCLSVNSNSKTISRNTALFWILFQMSLIVGNTIEYCLFRKVDDISDKQRITLYTVFGVGAAIGTLLLLLIRVKKSTVNNDEVEESKNDVDATNEKDAAKTFTPWQAFLQSFRLCMQKRMLLFFCLFAYTGFELTFFSGVYGTAVGQTIVFGNQAKGYIALIGLMIGVGEITGSLLMNRISAKFSAFTPDFIIIIGLIVHSCCFFLIFISLPFSSTQKPSVEPTFIEPIPAVVILCGYLLGFGDSIFNTQIITILGDSYKGIDNPSAFALFKFVQSLASGIGFFYSKYLALNWQLLILVVTSFMGTITFLILHRIVQQDKYDKLKKTDINVGQSVNIYNGDVGIDNPVGNMTEDE